MHVICFVQLSYLQFASHTIIVLAIEESVFLCCIYIRLVSKRALLTLSATKAPVTDGY